MRGAGIEIVGSQAMSRAFVSPGLPLPKDRRVVQITKPFHLHRQGRPADRVVKKEETRHEFFKIHLVAAELNLRLLKERLA